MKKAENVTRAEELIDEYKKILTSDNLIPLCQWMASVVLFLLVRYIDEE